MTYRFPMLLLPLLLAAPLFAQHYQGRDHMIFHRSSPPTKHALSVAPGVSAGMHATEATRRKELAHADKQMNNPAQSSAKTK